MQFGNPKYHGSHSEHLLPTTLDMQLQFPLKSSHDSELDPWELQLQAKFLKNNPNFELNI